MRQFLLNLPVELEDAARIDGCNRLRVLAQIVLPLSGPALVALAIFAFTASRNNFLWPLVVVTTPEMMTIQIGLASMKGEVIRWGPMLAATTISAIPVAVVYMVLQRYFTQGIAMTGLKG
jgi:ABC-type glycerol-3-phosphate transport system permease component